MAPNLGKLLHLVVLASGARTVLEIGTLAGYSAIWLARALPPGGRVVSLEADPRHAAIAETNISRAGLSEVVEIIVGPAAETLPKLVAQYGRYFDIVFIDADKPSTTDYFTWSLQLTHVGSLMLSTTSCGAGRWLTRPATIRLCKECSASLTVWRAKPRVSATAIQTVGSKGHDGFVFAMVTGGEVLSHGGRASLTGSRPHDASLSPRISQSVRMSQTLGPVAAATHPTGSFLSAAGTCGAAWSARRPVKPEVAGSNPVRSARSCVSCCYSGSGGACGAVRCDVSACGNMEAVLATGRAVG